MSEPDFSKAALKRFLDVAVNQGLLNPNTAGGLRAACSRLLEDVPDSDDVRKVDVKMAIKRYHNRHPGELKGTVLAEYERRFKRAVADFVQYTEDPTSYRGRGRTPSTKPSGDAQATRRAVQSVEIKPKTGALSIQGEKPAVVQGLSLEFPLRPDFLAQIVIPRDMKAAEAQRLSRFIMALAQDEPKPEG